MVQSLHRHVKIPWLTCVVAWIRSRVSTTMLRFCSWCYFHWSKWKRFVWTFDKITLNPLSGVRLTEKQLGLPANASVPLKSSKTQLHFYVVMWFDQISLTVAKQSISCHHVITQDAESWFVPDNHPFSKISTPKKNQPWGAISAEAGSKKAL